jgi:hypothetical protein
MKAYNAMQGQSSPPAQVVSITNTGEGEALWEYGLDYGRCRNEPGLAESFTNT